MSLDADLSQGMRAAPSLSATDPEGGSAFGAVVRVLGSDKKPAFVGGPENPMYRSLIPPPEPDPWPDEPATIEAPYEATVAAETPVPVARQAGAKRVAIYTARNDQFAVIVEEAPDWEPVSGCSFKTDAANIEKVVEPLCRGLGVKFIDKTAGDLEEAMETQHPKPTPIRRTRRATPS